MDKRAVTEPCLSWWSRSKCCDGRPLPLRCWLADDEDDDEDVRRSCAPACCSSLAVVDGHEDDVVVVDAVVDDVLVCDDGPVENDAETGSVLDVDVVVDVDDDESAPLAGVAFFVAHEKPPPPGPNVNSPFKFLFVIDLTYFILTKD